MTTSAIPTRPPETSTLAISRAPCALSGKVQNAHSQRRASTEPSASGTASASATTKLTRPVRLLVRAASAALVALPAHGRRPGAAGQLGDAHPGLEADHRGEAAREVEPPRVVALAEKCGHDV